MRLSLTSVLSISPRRYLSFPEQALSLLWFESDAIVEALDDNEDGEPLLKELDEFYPGPRRNVAGDIL